jgi:hypothetical protein
MKEKELNSWAEFEMEIAELEAQRARLGEYQKPRLALAF